MVCFGSALVLSDLQPGLLTVNDCKDRCRARLYGIPRQPLTGLSCICRLSLRLSLQYVPILQADVCARFAILSLYLASAISQGQFPTAMSDLRGTSCSTGTVL